MEEPDVRGRIEAAKQSFEFGSLTDTELISLASTNSMSDVIAAEISRRQLNASSALKIALEKTSRRLYWLNVVLAIYTVALLVVGVVSMLLRR